MAGCSLMRRRRAARVARQAHQVGGDENSRFCANGQEDLVPERHDRDSLIGSI
jgi:hypothetical protein